MSRAVIILLGLLALALLIFLCVRNHSTDIQADIQSRTSNTLSANPTSWVKVNTNGRDVILSGLAPSETLRNKAEDMARAVPGVVNVDNQIKLAQTELADTSIPEPELEPQLIHSPYKTQFTKTLSGVTLSGLVPDEKKRIALIQIAETKFGIGNVFDQLEVGMGAPENWLQTATALISNLALFKEGNADITDMQLKLTGQVINNNAKNKIEDNLKSQLSNAFSIDLDLTSPPTVAVEPKAIPPQNLVVSCSDQFKQLLADENMIHFSTDSSKLQTQSQKVVEQIIHFASACPNSIIEVAGYTDSRGSESYNLTLSQNRAKAIASELIKNGFPTKMLEIKGHGESSPSSDNKTEQGQANNRRIEFRYLREGE